MMHGSEQDARALIRPVKQQVEDELISRPGVNGVDIGYKVSNGQNTGRLAIVVYVDRKRSADELGPEELIPPEIEGIPTDVVEERPVLHPAVMPITEITPQIDKTAYSTLQGGISMGPCRSVHLVPPDVPVAGDYVFAGTLGAIVTDRATGATMALTNFHVACIDANWQVGDSMAQQSLADGGSCPIGKFGTLTRAALSQHVDGAVVTLDSGKTSACQIVDIGYVMGSAPATVGLNVQKRGRTTGLTHGSITSVDFTVSIDYGDGLGPRVLRNQIRVAVDTTKSAKFSDHGDSGSVVVDNSRNVIGLLFAGNDVPGNPALSGTVSYANPIQFALDELNVDLCVRAIVVVTNPATCWTLVTKPIVCVVTKPYLCGLVTKPVICDIVRTKACPVVTAFCPPVSLACPRPGPGPDPGPIMAALQAAGGSDPRSWYGVPGAERIDDAFWLGYYMALDSMSSAQAGQGD